MTSVSPDKLRSGWRTWVTAVNCGFWIPNHLSFENLTGEKKNNQKTM